MSDASDETAGPEPEPGQPRERAGDALRGAVERTLAATAGSASGTRQRAQELLDEVARRGEVARDELGRRGDAARQEVARRGEAAREEVAKVGGDASNRLADAIADLRQASGDESGPLSERIGSIERRLAELERALRRDRPASADSGDKPLDEAGKPTKANPQVEVEPQASGADPADSGG